MWDGRKERQVQMGTEGDQTRSEHTLTTAGVPVYCVICRNVTMHPETVKNPYKYVTIQTS